MPERQECVQETERWMGPQGWGRKGGPPGKAQSSASWGSQGLRGHGAQDSGQLQGSQIGREPLPHRTQALVSLLSFLLQEGGRSPDLGTDSLPLPSSQRALHSLISGSCCSVALSPFRFQAKYWYSLPTSPPLLCPWGPSSRQPWLNPPSIKTRPLLPSLPEELLTDVLTYFGRLDFLIPRIWGWEGP